MDTPVSIASAPKRLKLPHDKERLLAYAAFDLRQEAQCELHQISHAGYAEGDVLSRLLSIAAEDAFAPPANAYPFTAADFHESGREARHYDASRVIHPDNILDHIDTFVPDDQLSGVGAIPLHVSQYFEELLFCPDNDLSKVEKVQVAPSRTSVLMRDLLSRTGLPAMADESIFDVTCDFLRHRNQLVNRRRARLHCMCLVPQGGGKTPVFQLTKKALSSLKQLHPRWFILGPSTNCSECAWMSDFEQHSSTCLQMSDEFSSLLRGNASTAPRTSVLLKGFMDGEFAPGDNRYHNAHRVNKFLIEPRMNRAGMIQLDRAEELVFGAIKGGDAGEYKRVELSFAVGGSCSLSSQVPIDGSIRELRTLQLEGVLRVRGQSVEPTNAKLTVNASDLLHSADSYFRSLAPRLTVPARNLISDCTNHLLGHALAKASIRLSENWILYHRHEAGAEVVEQEEPMWPQCYCKLPATARLLNDPSWRSVLSKGQYGEDGYCCNSWNAARGKPKNDCGFVLALDEASDYMNDCTVLPKCVRSDVTQMRDLDSITRADVVFAINHTFRAIATLELACRARSIRSTPGASTAPSVFSFEDYVAKYERLLSYSTVLTGGERCVRSYHMAKVFGRNPSTNTFERWRDSSFLSRFLLGDEVSFFTRQGTTAARRSIVACDLRKASEAFFLPSLAQYPVNMIFAPKETSCVGSAMPTDPSLMFTDDDAVVPSIEVLRQEEPFCVAKMRASAGNDAESMFVNALEFSGAVAIYRRKGFGRLYAGACSLQMAPKRIRSAGLPDHAAELDIRRSFYSILLRQYERHKGSNGVNLPFLKSFVCDPCWVPAIAAFHDADLAAAKRFAHGLLYDSATDVLNNCRMPQILLLRNEIRLAISSIAGAGGDPLWHAIKDARPDAHTLSLYLGDYESSVMLEMRSWLIAQGATVHCLVFDGVLFSGGNFGRCDQPDGEYVFQDVVAKIKRIHRAEESMQPRKNSPMPLAETAAIADNCDTGTTLLTAVTPLGLQSATVSLPLNLGELEIAATGNCLARAFMAGFPGVRSLAAPFLERESLSCANLPFATRAVAAESNWSVAVWIDSSGEVGHAMLARRFDKDTCWVSDGGSRYVRSIGSLRGVLVEAAPDCIAEDFAFSDHQVAGLNRIRKTAQDLPNASKKLADKTLSKYKCRPIQRYLCLPQLKPSGYVEAAKKSNRTKEFHRCGLCGETEHKAPTHKYFFNSLLKHPAKRLLAPKAIVEEALRSQRAGASSGLTSDGKCSKVSSAKLPGRYTLSGKNYLPSGPGATRTGLRLDKSISTVDLCDALPVNLWGRFCSNSLCRFCGALAPYPKPWCDSKKCRSRNRCVYSVLAPLATDNAKALQRQLIVVRNYVVARPVGHCHLDCGLDRRSLCKYYNALTKTLCAEEKANQLTISWAPPSAAYSPKDWAWQVEADEALVGRRVEKVPNDKSVRKYTSGVVMGFMQRGDVQSLMLRWTGHHHMVGSARRMPKLPDAHWHSWWRDVIRSRFLLENDADMRRRLVLNTDGHEMYKPKKPFLCYGHRRVIHEDKCYWLRELSSAEEWGTQIIDRCWRDIRHYGRLRDGTTAERLLDCGEERVFAAAWLIKAWDRCGEHVDPMDRVVRLVVECAQRARSNM